MGVAPAAGEQEGEMSERRVFTFGFGHEHPVTGQRLANRYVIIEAADARAEMVRRFGTKWSFEYPDESAAGVGQFGLRELTGDAALGVLAPTSEAR